ncbi:MAG TPA: alpha amylase N-terminal ig-like domain-containing protein, partial [Chloroflexota bacterium]|nr:alpha amylase N-terminal ig-like domain-containing protein [Chloroflexota bacterium]
MTAARQTLKRGIACRLLTMACAALALALPLAGQGAATAALPQASCHDPAPGAIQAANVFHDGGPLFLQPTEPGPDAPVTLTLRTAACDARSVLLVYRPTFDAPRRSVPMRQAGHDATGRYDLWRVTLRTGAAGSTLTYRFELRDGPADGWYGANGYATTSFGAGYFTIAPGFHTPAWAQGTVFYQIFPDRFKNGNPANDVKTGEYNYQGNPVLAQPWTVLPENPGLGRDFFGGDLAGIMQELTPYL